MTPISRYILSDSNVTKLPQLQSEEHEHLQECRRSIDLDAENELKDALTKATADWIYSSALPAS
jgi:hypothetical protein